MHKLLCKPSFHFRVDLGSQSFSKVAAEFHHRRFILNIFAFVFIIIIIFFSFAYVCACVSEVSNCSCRMFPLPLT